MTEGAPLPVALPLLGRRILVTRPAAVAGALCALIEASGGEPVLFPTLDILPARDRAAVAALLATESLARRDLVIFVSPTAVAAAFALSTAPWPPSVAVAAVGGGTAKALAKHGAAAVLVPATGADSEALAGLPRLQSVKGDSILIVRGEGGREWLGDTLRARGARVDYAECYRRAMPEADTGSVVAQWTRGGIDASIVTSREALDNLVQLFGGIRDTLLSTPLFVSHVRIAERARQLGFTRVFAGEAGDVAMLRALEGFFARN